MGSIRVFMRLRELLDVLISSPADGEVLTYNAASSKWKNLPASGGGGGSFNGGTITDPLVIDNDDQTTISLQVEAGPGAVGNGQTQGRIAEFYSGDGTRVVAFRTAAAFDGSNPATFYVTEGEVDINIDPNGGIGFAVGTPDITYLNVTPTGALAAQISTGSTDDPLDVRLEDGSIGLRLTFSGNVYFPGVHARVMPTGAFVTAQHAAPADADLSTGECAIWFDQTNGAPKLMVKAKQADGTVVTGAVNVSASGTSFQPLDSDLTAIAGLSPTNDDIVQRKAGAWTNRTMAQLIADLAALGTTFQPLDGELTALAGLTSAADKMPYFTGSGTAATTTVSSFIRTLLDDADQATAQSTLGITSSNPPSARVTHNAAQSITNGGSGTALAFNTERWDTDTIHDTSTNNSRLTCKTAGKYLVIGNVEWAASSSGSRALTIKKNGTTLEASVWTGNNGGTNPLRQQISQHIDLAVNDYVELVAFQDGSGAINIAQSANYTPEFSMTKVAA